MGLFGDIINSSPIVLKTVSSVESTSGGFTRYSYGTPVIDTDKGRGFLGFDTISRVTSKGTTRTGTQQVYGLVYRSTLNYDLMPLSTTDSINGNAVSTTSYTYFSKLVNSKRYIVSDSVVSQDLINNIKTVSNYYDYDEFLIPERMKTRSYSGTVLEAETIDSLEYYHDTSKWLLGQLLDKTTVQSRPGETDYTRKYEHTYYPNGSLRESYKERGTGNEIKTTFTYEPSVT